MTFCFEFTTTRRKEPNFTIKTPNFQSDVWSNVEDYLYSGTRK